MTFKDKIEYYEIVNPILNSNEFQRRKFYKHHGDITVYEHCLAVSKVAYILAKKFKKDYRSAAIAGLLHDFYCEDWQKKIKKEKFFQKHGFTHAKDALLNSKIYYPEFLNDVIENSILRHMFPLNKIPPKYVEGWIINFADKYVSLEVFKHPKSLPMLIGIKRKVREKNE